MRRPRFRLSEAACAVRAFGGSGDLHADETGQQGENTAADESEGGKPGQHLSVRQKGHSQQDDKHHSKDLAHGAVLLLQIGVGTGTDGSCQTLHFLCSLGETHHFPRLRNGKHTGSQCAGKAQPKQIFHLFHSFPQGGFPSFFFRICSFCSFFFVPYPSFSD